MNFLESKPKEFFKVLTSLRTLNSIKDPSSAGRAFPQRIERKPKSDDSFIVKKIKSIRAKLCRFFCLC
uniref:Uncharacterized protein n=1 Tax=Cucumis melo TaxID=3656 RepID=A0A9I9E8J6_CUCME